MGLQWYSRYPADNASDTKHLSMLEKGAYIELMDFYYSSGKPLPKDCRRIYRISGAETDEEKQASDTVISFFFTLIDGEYHQPRIDKELKKRFDISKIRKKAAKNSRKVSTKKISTANAQQMLSKCSANAHTTTTTTTTTIKETDKKKIPKKKNACVSDEMLFDLWDAFPKIKPKGGRKEFYQSVKKQISKGVSYETIENGIRRYAQHCNEKGTYNKHAFRWIDKGAWDADYSTTEAPPPKNSIAAEIADYKAEKERERRNDTAQEDHPDTGGSGILAQLSEV